MISRIVLILLVCAALLGCDSDGWRTARNDSAGIAPSPDSTQEAVVQVYGAAVYGWRGSFADHTWIATKPAESDAYTIYQVIGWRLRQGRSVVSISEGIPDRHWYGSEPTLYLDLRGPEAAQLIQPIKQAARSYPHANEYTMWPGPNSNSFVQWIALEVPQLELELTWRAWGKNWMKENYQTSRGSVSVGN